MKTTTQQIDRRKLYNLGRDYSEVFIRHSGNLFRTGSAESQEAIKKTAHELDLTKSHVRAALDAYQWG